MHTSMFVRRTPKLAPLKGLCDCALNLNTTHERVHFGSPLLVSKGPSDLCAEMDCLKRLPVEFGTRCQVADVVENALSKVSGAQATRDSQQHGPHPCALGMASV